MSHKSASYGSNPPEANSKGSLNESVPMDQRSPEGEPMGSGPKVNLETGSYAPATYEQTINHPQHGVQTLIRTDR